MHANPPRKAFEQVIATVTLGGFIALADCDPSTQLSGPVIMVNLADSDRAGNLVGFG